MMLSLLPTLSLAYAAERVANVAVRRVQPDRSLPWVYEADWALEHERRRNDGDSSPLRHDPLSSCFWPAALPLARYLQSAEWLVRDRVVVELGVGTGLCALTAAANGASRVIATDVSPLSLELTDAAAAAQGLSSTVRTMHLDATKDEQPLPPDGHVLLLSDLFVTSALARAHARRCAEAVARGFSAVVVADPGRTTRACFLDELARCHVRHEGFRRALPVDEADGAPHGRSSTVVLLLDSEEGVPVSYDI